MLTCNFNALRQPPSGTFRCDFVYHRRDELLLCRWTNCFRVGGIRCATIMGLGECSENFKQWKCAGEWFCITMGKGKKRFKKGKKWTPMRGNSYVKDNLFFEPTSLFFNSLSHVRFPFFNSKKIILIHATSLCQKICNIHFVKQSFFLIQNKINRWRAFTQFKIEN